MGTLITYTFDELSSEVQESVLNTIKNSVSYKSEYDEAYAIFTDRVLGEESNELLETNDNYIITDTDILIDSVYDGDNLDLDKLYHYYILGDVSVYKNQTFTVKVNYDTEPIRELVNTFQEDILEWANTVLGIVEERQADFTEDFYSNSTVAEYIRTNNFIFTVDGERIIIA